MRRFIALLLLVGLFGAVVPVASAEGPDDPVAIVMGGEAAISHSTLNAVAGIVGDAERVAGANRYATAASLAMGFYEGAGSEYVYVATGQHFPDALAGSPAAAVDEAPILLVTRDTIPQPTATALADLAPRVIYVLGGPNAVSQIVANGLAGYADEVVRLSGASRYETAAAISRNTFNPGVKYAHIATGENFPDALAGGAAAGIVEGPMLLVRQGSIPPATATELRRLNPEEIVVFGGPAAVSSGVLAALQGFASKTAFRIAGADRYDTAVAISEALHDFTINPVIATGENFPDALAAGPIAAMMDEPVFLVRRNALPAVTANELDRLISNIP